MSRRLPPLNSLRAFEAAARHLSFTAAADELNVTPAAVSQQIKVLEAYFDLSLFRRLTRALVLTESGEMILPLLSEGLDKLAEADSLLRNRAADNIISVSVSPAIGMWLLPRLDSFRRFAPQYDIRIDASEMNVDFQRENFDLALRFGSNTYEGLISDCMFNERIVVVCSPCLLEGEHPLKKVADIRHHTLLHSTSRLGQRADIDWRMWLKAAGVHDVDSERGPQFNLHSFAIQAAIQGQGVALIDESLISRELASGELIKPFDDSVGISTEGALCYSLVYPEGKQDDVKVITFRDWLMTELDEFE